MPKGIPKKKDETVLEKEAPHAEIKKEKEDVVLSKPVVSKPALPVLVAGQAYFEAPDGHIIIGEDSKDQTWYRQGNGGKGMWINKKR